MPTMQDVIRRITIQAKGEGVEQTEASLRKLAGAQDAVAVASETTSKASLSAQSALNALRRSVDEEYRSEQNLEKAERTLAAARNQGIIGITEQNRLLGLASDKYRATGESAKAIGENMARAKELAVGLIGGLGAGLLLTGLAELPAKIKESVEAAANLKDTAETIGITAKSLQELDYAGSQSGVGVETLNSALEKFSVNLGKAQKGSGDLYNTLKINHVAITGDVTKDFESYANLVQGATSAEQRNMLVTAAFGKSAADLGRIFNGGAAGVKRLADEANNAGAVLNDNTLASAKELDDEFAKMQLQLDTSFEGFMVNIAPAIESSLAAITAAVQLATAAVDAGKWAVEQALPVTDRSTAHLEQDLAQRQSILSRTAGNSSGMRNSAGQVVPNPGFNPMRRSIGNGQAVDIQAQIDADQAELTHRNAAAVSGFIDTNSANGGWGSLPTPTKTFTAPDAAAAARAAAALKQAQDIQKVTDALNLQLKNLTATDREQAINNELGKAHVDISSKDGKAIADLAGKYYDEKRAIDDNNKAMAFYAQTAETALESVLDGSKTATQALDDMAKAIEQAVLQAALLGSGPLGNIFGGASTTSGQTGGFLGSLLSGFGLGGASAAAPSGAMAWAGLSPNAKGGIYSSPNLSAYSNGIVAEPTFFRYANGGGLMGEAGPEAIMPLSRGPDGRLGIAAANSNGELTVNVQIIRQPGSGEDSATAKRSGNNIDIVALINDTAATGAAAPGSSLNRSIRVALGGRQQLTRR